MEDERSEGESEIDSDFEFDDDIKQSLNSLLSVPLEFEESSSDEEKEEQEKEVDCEVEAAIKTEEVVRKCVVADKRADEIAINCAVAEKRAQEIVSKCMVAEKKNEGIARKSRDDIVEKNLKALFAFGSSRMESEDTGLENISDNELDGMESGECDSSDGELPDSPTLVRRVPEQRLLVDKSDTELMGRCPPTKEVQEVVKKANVEDNLDPEKPKSPKKKKDKTQSKTKEKSLLNKIKVKKENIRKSQTFDEDDLKNQLKVKKYLARIEQYRLKCFEYVSKISSKCDNVKTEINHIKPEKKKKVKVRSVVEKVNNEREASPHSSTSSKIDRLSHSSKAENTSVSSKDSKQRRSSLDKGRKSKSSKKSKIIPEEQLVHYANYIQYLQSEREKCFEENHKKHKHKSKKKHKKRASSSPDKVKDKAVHPHFDETKVLTYDEFCKSRELSSPCKDNQETRAETKPTEHNIENSDRSKTILAPASTTTTTTERRGPLYEDTELFITYSDLVEQDKQKGALKDDKSNDKLEEILEKDPEMKSISVFTSVLFKSDSSGIPFLQEGRVPSPTMEPLKPRPVNIQLSGPDEIYDCDDLSSISLCSLSPSRSPAPKTHNQALLNFLENQRVSKEYQKQTPLISKRLLSSKSSPSRSKSPKREESKLRKRKPKKHSSESLSPSPPPIPMSKSPEYKNKQMSPNYLKKRWKDYPSPPDRHRDYDSPPPRRKDYSSPPDRRKEYFDRLIKGRRR